MQFWDSRLQHKKRREDFLRRFAQNPPAGHRSGGARQALPAHWLLKRFFGLTLRPRPGCFMRAVAPDPDRLG